MTRLPTLPLGALVALLMACTGCVSMPSSPSAGRLDLLSFLTDGSTAKSEVLLKLGQPSGTFSAEEILTYRVGFEPKGKGYWIVERETGTALWSSWQGVRYSLVLVFDKRAILQRHAMIDLRGGNP